MKYIICLFMILSSFGMASNSNFHYEKKSAIVDYPVDYCAKMQLPAWDEDHYINDIINFFDGDGKKALGSELLKMLKLDLKTVKLNHPYEAIYYGNQQQYYGKVYTITFISGKKKEGDKRGKVPKFNYIHVTEPKDNSKNSIEENDETQNDEEDSEQNTITNDKSFQTGPQNFADKEYEETFNEIPHTEFIKKINNKTGRLILYAQEISEKNDRKDEVDEKISEITKKKEALINKNKVFNKEIKENENKITEYEEKIIALKKDIDLRKDSIKNNEKKLNHKNLSIEKYKAEKNLVENDINQLKRKYQELEKTLPFNIREQNNPSGTEKKRTKK